MRAYQVYRAPIFALRMDAIFCAGAYGARARAANFLGQGPAQEILVLVLGVIGRAAHKHKMPVAIAAIDIALFINLKPDAGMAQCGRDITAAVASNARFTDSDRFRFVVHARRVAKPLRGCNGSEIIERDRPVSRIHAGCLVRGNVKRGTAPIAASMHRVYFMACPQSVISRDCLDGRRSLSHAHV